MADTPRGQIVAMGGGGFSMEPENPLLDDYILSLSRRKPARVCFVPTASGDSPPYVARFYRALSSRCIPADLTLVDSALPRRPATTGALEPFIDAIAQGLAPGYAADDGAALHFIGQELSGVVASRPKAKAYRVSLREGRVVEEVFAARFLGG